MEFQTRSEETGINNFDTLAKALEAAKQDISIWKISFSLPTGERVRLVLEDTRMVSRPNKSWIGKNEKKGQVMCEFSHEGSKLVNLSKEEAIPGHRFWIYNFRESRLKSLYIDFYFTDKITVGDTPNLDGNSGLYSYNYNYNYYNNNYYNNNYNNYNYNYYNNNYNNYNYNYYYYYNYNYNYNYYIAGLIKSYGPTVIHTIGQRSKEIEITAFLSLKNHENKVFLSHFNKKIEQAAKQFGVSVISYQYGEDIPEVK